MKYNNSKWYSVIISVLLIWFLLLITTAVFNLVLKEYHDSKWLWDSIKAFAWAEASQELALLKIKEKWYWIDDKINHNVSTWSILLADDITNTWSFKHNKDTFISYDLKVLADYNSILKYHYNSILEPNWYSIIPLFYELEWWTWMEFVRNYTLNVNWSSESLVWNLISGQEWIGNHGGILTWWSLALGNWKKITINGDGDREAQKVANEPITTFLTSRDNAYLILFNSWNSNVDFTLNSPNKFSKPKTTILSSAQVWKYRHNLETQYDNTEFLNMLKYAVFSE